MTCILLFILRVTLEYRHCSYIVAVESATNPGSWVTAKVTQVSTDRAKLGPPTPSPLFPLQKEGKPQRAEASNAARTPALQSNI